MALIAVVDDNEGVLATLGLLLRSRHEDHVTLYNDPARLLDAVESGVRPDLVITDFSMPGMSGGNLLDAIARMDGDIPGIVITGYPEGLGAYTGRYPVLCKGTADFIPALLAQVATFLGHAASPAARPVVAKA